MKAFRPLAVAAALALGLLTLMQSWRLIELDLAVRERCARAEMAGLARALHWRYERDLALGQHDSSALRAGLEDVLLADRTFSWAAVYAADGTRQAAAGTAPELPASLLDSIVKAPPDDLPRMEAGQDKTVIGLTRLSLAQREFVLAAGFADDPASGLAPAGAIGKGLLVAGLAAALLLFMHGLAPPRRQPDSLNI